HARREELEGRHGLVRPPRDDARGRRGRPAGPRPPDARDRRADLEALLRREGRQLAARQVPAEGGARADGARGLHSSEVRGQPEPVPCREVEADRGRARPRGLPGVRAPLPPGDRGRQRVSRAAGQAVHPMEAAGDAAARSGPDASQEVIVGGGGDGAEGTGAAYGANPLPPYPLVARRLGMEGVVLLEVVVAPDGHAAEVRVARSSGYPALDESALTTVRERWRFIPAHRDGVP